MYWDFLFQQNRPLNSQNVADALQKFNLKKTAVQKALDSLCDGGQISFKEYGKQKIYLARQDQFSIPNAEELDLMKKKNTKLQEDLRIQAKANTEIETGTDYFQNRFIWSKSWIKFLDVCIDFFSSRNSVAELKLNHGSNTGEGCQTETWGQWDGRETGEIAPGNDTG